MSRRLLAPAILFAALAAAACGATPAATTPADDGAEPTQAAATEPAASSGTGGGVEGNLEPGTDLNACEIVTPADVAAATGIDGSVTDGTLEEKPDTLSPNKTECTYEGDFGRILVQLVPEDGANLYDAARGSYKDASDITGIGDGAFNSVQNRRAFVWQDRVAVMLTMFLNGDLEQLDVATELGQSIVAKL